MHFLIKYLLNCQEIILFKTCINIIQNQNSYFSLFVSLIFLIIVLNHQLLYFYILLLLVNRLIIFSAFNCDLLHYNISFSSHLIVASLFARFLFLFIFFIQKKIPFHLFFQASMSVLSLFDAKFFIFVSK